MNHKVDTGENIQSFTIEEKTGGINQTSQLTADLLGVELVITGVAAGSQSLVIKITTTLGRVNLEKVWFSVKEL